MDDSNNCKMESILQNATDQQQTVTDKKNSQRLEKIAVSTNLQRKWKVLLPPLFSRCVEGGLTEHKPRLMNALAAIDLHSTPFCTFPIFRGSIISKKIHPGKPHFGYHPTYFPFKRQHGFHFVRKCTYLCGQ